VFGIIQGNGRVKAYPCIAPPPGLIGAAIVVRKEAGGLKGAHKWHEGFLELGQELALSPSWITSKKFSSFFRRNLFSL
jgi:hypothetical protein